MNLADLVGVDAADVYKAGKLAGHLRRVVDDVVFAYADDYLADPSTPSVAFTLPKQPEPIRAAAGAVPAYFAGLLPEGARLQAVTTAARTSLDDQLTLLLVVGADAIGDVQVLPQGAPLADPGPLFDVHAASADDFVALVARAVSADPLQIDRVALPGVQAKVSAAMISTPLGTTAGPAILKLDPGAYPRLVANEDFFLSMAADCGLPVPRHQLLHDRLGRAALLVDRFDRVSQDGNFVRVPQEDACQVLGRYPAAKYRLSFQDVAVALADAVDQTGGSRPLAMRRLLEIGAFSYLIGNGDLHGKNLSIRRSTMGAWEVTPAYDLLSTQPYTGWQDPMALAMYGRANRLGRRWWLDAADRLRVPQRAVAAALDKIVDRSESWLERIHRIGFDQPTTQRLRDLIATRRAELSD
jgi:serine/threonine-protein kinase HipA